MSLTHAHGVCEQDLPACVRDVLESARAVRPGTDVTCVAFHTRDNAIDVTCLEPLDAATRIHRKDILVLSVAVTETTAANVQTVTHVLIARTRPNRDAC